MKYTIEQLIHLRNIRAIGFDNSFSDDQYGTEKQFFECETEKFFNWIEKMEKNGKINSLIKNKV